MASTRRAVLLLGCACALSLFGRVESLRGQTRFFDNFDEYDSGTPIAGQGAWELWDGNAIDADVSDEEASSEPNSLRMREGTDIVTLFDDVTSGTWSVSTQVYIPKEMFGNAWVILLNTYSHGGAKNWSTQVQLNSFGVNSLGGTEFQGIGTTVTITDEWIEVRVEIDLDNNVQRIFYDGLLLDETPWQMTGKNAFEAIDLFANEGAVDFFFDDVEVRRCLSATADVDRGLTPLEVSFEAGEFQCGTTAVEEYRWDFGDGTQGSGREVTHTYAEPGVYRATLEIEDTDGGLYQTSLVVTAECESTPVDPWILETIGEASWPGCVLPADECVEVVAGGLGFDRNGDEFVFPHQVLRGDFSVTARVDVADWVAGTHVGIHARETLRGGSPFVTSTLANRGEELGIVPGWVRRFRANGAHSERFSDAVLESARAYLRLDRVGEQFTGFVSLDGVDWTQVRSQALDEPPEDLFVGLVASPGGPASSARAVFCEAVGFAGGPPGGPQFRRGDVDDSGGMQLTDAIFVLNHLFLGSDTPTCRETADVDDDGQLAITDAISILNFLFLGGDPPAAPGPADCGPDGDDSPDVTCEAYTSC